MEYITIEDFEENIQVNELKKYLNRNNIKYQSIEIINEKQKKGKANAIVMYRIKDIPDITVFDNIDMQPILNTQSIIQISFGVKDMNIHLQQHRALLSNDGEDTEKDVIEYSSLYHQHIITQFIRVVGEEGLRLNDLPMLNIQRSIMQRYMSKIGFNIMTKSALLNITLPISIFDQRSLLEVFAHQLILSPHYLEKAGGLNDNPIEVLKLTTAFFISQLHLLVTQLKPFNPLTGETFQCKIGESLLYLETPTEESLAFNFYHVGKHFKSYGYQIPYAITRDNGVTVSLSGNHEILYPNGTVIKMIPCGLNIKGTIKGQRTLRLFGQCFIIDKMNNYLVYLDFNKNTAHDYPDMLKGYILRLDQSTYNPRNNTYSLNKNFTSLVDINGHWTSELIFDDDVYWNYYEYTHYPLKRMRFTLASDSSFREDIIYLKTNQEGKAVQMRAYLENVQRRDKKLRQ